MRRSAWLLNCAQFEHACRGIHVRTGFALAYLGYPSRIPVNDHVGGIAGASVRRISAIPSVAIASKKSRRCDPAGASAPDDAVAKVTDEETPTSIGYRRVWVVKPCEQSCQGAAADIKGCRAKFGGETDHSPDPPSPVYEAAPMTPKRFASVLLA